MSYARRWSRATLWSPVVVAVVLVGCRDEPPTEPSAELEFTPSFETHAPNTADDCGGASPCLKDDVTDPWSVIPVSGTSVRVTTNQVDAPTTAGSTIYYQFCRFRQSDDFPLGCDEPDFWGDPWEPHRPSRKITINGYWPGGDRLIVKFESFAPEPVIELLEYERPNPVVCTGAGAKYCQGPFRVKLAVRNAGWYRDEIRSHIGHSGSLSGWNTGDADLVTSGEVVEWTWDQLIAGEDDLMLVILYRPWDGSDDGMQRIELPIRAASASLTLTATPSVLELPGDTVTFTPEAAGAGHIEVLQWTWTPDDSALTPQTVACAPTEDTCVTEVYEDGTMEVEARVDGQERLAYAHVEVDFPVLELSADPSQQWTGDTITFTPSAEGSTSLTVLEWIWMPADSNGTPQTQPCAPGEDPCRQPVFESGTMRVRAMVDGVEQIAAASATTMDPCPADPFASDSVVEERFRELWYYSYPDSAIEQRKERMGFIVDMGGTFDVEWHPALADPCNVQDPANPNDAPANTVAWVHTHPADSGTVIPAGTCLYHPNGGIAGHGPGPNDDDYTELLEIALGQPVVGYILEHRGLTRFTTADPDGDDFPACNSWQAGTPIFPEQLIQ